MNNFVFFGTRTIYVHKQLAHRQFRLFLLNKLNVYITFVEKKKNPEIDLEHSNENDKNCFIKNNTFFFFGCFFLKQNF